MRYVNATNFQRFIAFFIDYMLLGLVSGLILRFIPAYQNNYKILLSYVQQILEGNLVEEVDTLAHMLKASLKLIGIRIGFELPIFFLYMVILPYFWKSQTLGRAAIHIRVISLTGDKLSIGKLALRELIGGYLMINVLGGSFIFLVLTWYFSMTTGRSLADMIGGTRLIDERRSYDEEDRQTNSKDYVDATFKDVTNPDNPYDPSNKSDYDVF